MSLGSPYYFLVVLIRVASLQHNERSCINGRYKGENGNTKLLIKRSKIKQTKKSSSRSVFLRSSNLLYRKVGEIELMRRR